MDNESFENLTMEQEIRLIGHGLKTFHRIWANPEERVNILKYVQSQK